MAGEKGMLEDMWESLTNASNEAIEIFKSAFNVTGAIPTKPKPGKMFYFGDPSDFDMADLSANPSQWMQFKNSVKGFVSAVEWTEKWIIALGVFHIMMLLLAILSRKHTNVQMVLFCFLMGCIYLAEPLNRFLSTHWESFSTQNYFDKHGVFLSVVWSTPLLLIGAYMVIQTLIASASLLVQVKRREILQHARANKEKAGKDNESEKKKQ
uniref:Transmembrane protein 18 n=1 Tax=Hanusia phi TaxID=3032 RepID=A0A7S0HWS5_9CRYP|mmetsp:Transcript_524/g.1185  ORF Transcript_524/g.1185 Transcript_524/m.1185 type:complete len:210 (+) Transcript_524:766-1395(+)